MKPFSRWRCLAIAVAGVVVPEHTSNAHRHRHVCWANHYAMELSEWANMRKSEVSRAHIPAYSRTRWWCSCNKQQFLKCKDGCRNGWIGKNGIWNTTEIGMHACRIARLNSKHLKSTTKRNKQQKHILVSCIGGGYSNGGSVTVVVIKKASAGRRMQLVHVDALPFSRLERKCALISGSH